MALTDAEDARLLREALADGEAFGAFYDRHVHVVLAYFARRTSDPETAADLTAETFAAALTGLRSFRPERGAPIAWLFGIARREYADFLREGQAARRARRRMGLPVAQLTDEAIDAIGETVASPATIAALNAALADLPDADRRALEARVVEEEPHAGPAARQRISRLLRRLRDRMEETG
jgi:RNA polymerase sigma-70 factor (ECF subfamily)